MKATRIPLKTHERDSFFLIESVRLDALVIIVHIRAIIM